MASTPEEAKEEVARLGLPPVFTDVWSGNIPDVLDIDWQTPKAFFRIQDEMVRKFPRLATSIPLWESNRDHVYAYDKATGEYVVCYFRDEPYCEVIANNYQGFAAAYMADCVYSGEDNLDEIATLLEFKHLDKVKKWAEVESTSDSGEEKRKLVASIPPGR